MMEDEAFRVVLYKVQYNPKWSQSIERTVDWEYFPRDK